MRLIDADVLKEMVPTTSVDMFENCRNCSLLSEEQVLELIDMTPTVDVWIPWVIRSPSEKGEYLVTYHPCYYDNVEPEVKVGINTFRCKTSWANRKYQKVVAWMPLPEPWKGEK